MCTITLILLQNDFWLLSVDVRSSLFESSSFFVFIFISLSLSLLLPSSQRANIQYSLSRCYTFLSINRPTNQSSLTNETDSPYILLVIQLIPFIAKTITLAEKGLCMVRITN